MSQTILSKLTDVLAKIDRPGSFCTSGNAPAVSPGLQVKGMDTIAFPLTAAQAKELKAHCEQAPYGKGEETLVDPDVRRVWRLTPDKFQLTNPRWQQYLELILGTIQQRLGLEKQKLSCHLYDLLLYEPGSFFRPHRDGEKLERMVATLVLVLPSSFAGGELVVRHEGQEEVIDFGGGSASGADCHFAAFYADCEHEIRPLRKGYRLCLIYNLTLAKGKKVPTAPRPAEDVERVRTLLEAWDKAGTPEKLAVLLDHQYTQPGLRWDTLKGADRGKADVLLAAARQAACKIYLTLLTFHQSGSAEGEAAYGYESRYGGRSSRYRDRYSDEDEDEDEGDEDDIEGEYEMGEIIEESLTATDWLDPAGHKLPISELNVDEEELADPEALTQVKPEEEFEGYTGNAGMTLDRWYRHAALILWPESRHFAVLASAGSYTAVPVLNEMVEQFRKAKGKQAAALQAQATELARSLIVRWPENPHGHLYHAEKEGVASQLLRAVAALDDVDLVHAYLRQVLQRDNSAEPGPALVTVCQQHGWSTFRRELLSVAEATTAATMVRNVQLLTKVSLARAKDKEEWRELCGALASPLLAALEKIDAAPASDWQARNVSRSAVLAGLAQALLAADQEEMLARLVRHTLTLPKVYPLREAHLPALLGLETWVGKHLKEPCPPLAWWVDTCREQLEALTAHEPAPPADNRRAADFSCRCAECSGLRKFLEDPAASVHRIRAAQDQRSHVESQVRTHELDVSLKTETQGRPYTLVCTKNTASFQRQLKQYHQDLKSLAEIEALEKQLPA